MFLYKDFVKPSAMMVFVLMNEYNGYKNFIDVYINEAECRNRCEELRNKARENEYFYVIPTHLLGEIKDKA